MCRTKFLFVSDARSGTHMLQSALKAHPNVALFDLYDCVVQTQYHHDLPSKQQHHEAWLRFLEFGHPPETTHLGTFVHRVGAEWIGEFSPIPHKNYWQVLSQHHTKFICLHRENLLKQLLSHKVADSIKNFDVMNPRKATPNKLILSPGDLIDLIGDMNELQGIVDNHFLPRITVSYENLVQDWQGTIDSLQGFLGLPQAAIVPLSYRQETRTLQGSIENYAEIKDLLGDLGLSSWLE